MSCQGPGALCVRAEKGGGSEKITSTLPFSNQGHSHCILNPSSPYDTHLIQFIENWLEISRHFRRSGSNGLVNVKRLRSKCRPHLLPVDLVLTTRITKIFIVLH